MATARQKEEGVEVVTLKAGTLELVTRGTVLVGLEKLDGIGPKSARALKARGLRDQRDLALFMPRKYRRVGHHLGGALLLGRRMRVVEFYGEVTSVRPPAPGTRQPFSALVEVDGFHVKLAWFGGLTRASFTKQLREGTWLHVKGEVGYDRSIPEITHPTFEILGSTEPAAPEPSTTIEPIYPSIEGTKEAILRRAQLQALDRLLPHLVDVVPVPLLDKRDLPTIAQALRTIHVVGEESDPERFEQRLRAAQDRLAYEEFYSLQLKLARIWALARRDERAPRLVERELGRRLVRALPFKLTGDQAAEIARIAEAMAEPHPMRRMLQGDVGAGKTVVALMAAAIALGSGRQVALMAPTEILARQHMRRAEQWLAPLGVDLVFFGGSLGAADRRAALARLAEPAPALAVGTHALFTDEVVFGDLGLAIVDEQHKFGVEQRDALLAKGEAPHLLAMTATPIPRSLAHAVFGDLELGVIQEKPPGRQPIKTVLREREVAPKVFAYVRARIEERGEQAYFVYPMVEAGAAAETRRNVTEEARALAQGPLAGLRVGMLHGRLDGAEKDETMRRFADGELDVLCATTVIEVGVDVANATMMVIESPELFGLSQLHQLRGRVGRGEAASLCVLLAGLNTSEDATERLAAFAGTDDGFELAETDLRMRGPGLFLGARQSGQAEFRFGDLHRDAPLLAAARLDARAEVLEGAEQSEWR